MTHGESGPLVCHGPHKGQGLVGGRANVIDPTLLETPDGGTLVGGHEPSPAPEYTRDRIRAMTAFYVIFHKIALCFNLC